jgi:hypothetical protein
MGAVAMAIKTRPPYVLMASFWNAETANERVLQYFNPINAIEIDASEVPLSREDAKGPITVLVLILATYGLTKLSPVEVRIVAPDGAPRGLFVRFKGADNPLGQVEMIAPMGIGPSLSAGGLHWFEIVYEDRVLTRVPLNIKIRASGGSVH